MALFASLIIRLFQLVFSARTVFFSHNKSAGTMFRLVFSAGTDQLVAASKVEMSQVKSKRWPDAIDADGP